MKTERRHSRGIMSEWYSTARLFNLSPSETAVSAFRFGLIISISNAKEEGVADALDFNAESFQNMCELLKKCLEKMSPEELALSMIEMDPPSGDGERIHSSEFGPWGRRHK